MCQTSSRTSLYPIVPAARSCSVTTSRCSASSSTGTGGRSTSTILSKAVAWTSATARASACSRPFRGTSARRANIGSYVMCLYRRLVFTPPPVLNYCVSLFLASVFEYCLDKLPDGPLVLSIETDAEFGAQDFAPRRQFSVVGK